MYYRFYTLMVLYSLIHASVHTDDAVLSVWDGVRVEINCTGIEGSRPTWDINERAIDPGSAAQFLNDGIENKEDWNGEWFNILCIEIELKHQNYTLECRIGSKTLYNTTLRVHARLPPPENIHISHTSPEIHFQLCPPLFDVDSNEDVDIDIYPNITHYTVYITNLNTAQEMVYETADNSTEFTLTGLPGEDMNECTDQYVFEVAANNARAGEGERSEPQYMFIPRDCSKFNTKILISRTNTTIPEPTVVYPPIIIYRAVSVIVIVVVVSLVILIVWMRHKAQHSSETVLQSSQVSDVQQWSGGAVQLEPCSAYGVRKDTDPEYETVS